MSAGAASDSDKFSGEQPHAITAQCPNCGSAITLDALKLRGGGPVVCDNCREIIGVISDKI